MSDFWAAKLAGQAPPPETSQHAVWWSGEPAREADPLPPANYPAPAARDSERNSARCPECQSGNYMSPTRNAAFRCFDCGYPLLQSTSGARIGSGTPMGKPVRQVTGSGFHPHEIIARIG